MTHPAETKPCQELWASVLIMGLRDALGKISPTDVPYGRGLAQSRALSWIGSKDFHTVCRLAGFDGDFIESAVASGRIDPADLTHKARRAAA